ncbi:MAG: hypothetical protein LH650_09175 [Chloroflexi bacterium]|nr:hypothetical protein [Chloroflexota bacterium]
MATAPTGHRVPSTLRRWTMAATALVVAVMSVLTPSVAAAGPSDQLPDLRMAKPRDVRLVEYTTGPFTGQRLLRFTSIITNEGVGPLDVRGRRACASLQTCPTMTVKQRIKRSDGTWRTTATSATMQYDVGDGHKHWHVLGLQKYRLWRLGVADLTPLKTAKYGFCFFDTTRWLSSASFLPHYVSKPIGANPGCGDPSTLDTRVGLTPGWGDIYPWDFSGQYIDVTGVPTGEYLLCVRADPNRRFRQASSANDEAWVRVRLAGSTLTVRASGRSSCAKQRERFAPEASGGTGTIAAAAVEPGIVSFASVTTSAPRFLCRLRA